MHSPWLSTSHYPRGAGGIWRGTTGRCYILMRALPGSEFFCAFNESPPSRGQIFFVLLMRALPVVFYGSILYAEAYDQMRQVQFNTQHLVLKWNNAFWTCLILPQDLSHCEGHTWTVAMFLYDEKWLRGIRSQVERAKISCAIKYLVRSLENHFSAKWLDTHYYSKKRVDKRYYGSMVL